MQGEMLVELIFRHSITGHSIKNHNEEGEVAGGPAEGVIQTQKVFQQSPPATCLEQKRHFSVSERFTVLNQCRHAPLAASLVLLHRSRKMFTDQPHGRATTHFHLQHLRMRDLDQAQHRQDPLKH
jgi:hypothetical protein